MITRASGLSFALLAAGLVAGSAAAPPVRAGAASPDGTAVARIGGETITRGTLVRHLLTYFTRPAREQLVDRSVFRQEAARYGLSVSDGEIAARAAELKKAAGERHQAALDAEGIDEEAWRERIRYQLLAEKLLDRRWPIRDDDLTRASVRYARVQTQNVAKGIIADAKRGVSFELLAGQRSLDREFRGLIQPDPFFRIDNPVFYKLGMDSGLRVGQVSPEPIESGGYWLVVKLEKVFLPNTLTAAQRQAATQRIRAGRLTALLPTSKRRYEIKHEASLASLQGATPPADDTVVSRIAPGRAGAAGGDTVLVKDLVSFLLEYYGRRSLETLIDRSLVAAEARRLNVTVSDAEVTARVEGIKRDAEKKAKGSFQAALDREGITEDAWKQRVRYTFLAEKIQGARSPVKPEDLERLTVRYIRVGTQQAAEEVLQALRMGGKWEDLTQQRSLDRMGDGFVQPRIFLRVDQPVLFGAIPPGLQPGQVAPRPVELGGSYYILRVEGRFAANLMTAQERDAAVRQIQGARIGELLDTLRKQSRPEYLVPVRKLIAARA